MIDRKGHGISTNPVWLKTVFMGNVSSFGNYTSYPLELSFLPQKALEYTGQIIEERHEYARSVKYRGEERYGEENQYALLTAHNEKYNFLIREYKRLNDINCIYKTLELRLAETDETYLKIFQLLKISIFSMEKLTYDQSVLIEESISLQEIVSILLLICFNMHQKKSGQWLRIVNDRKSDKEIDLFFRFVCDVIMHVSNTIRGSRNRSLYIRVCNMRHLDNTTNNFLKILARTIQCDIQDDYQHLNAYIQQVFNRYVF